MQHSVGGGGGVVRSVVGGSSGMLRDLKGDPPLCSSHGWVGGWGRLLRFGRHPPPPPTNHWPQAPGWGGGRGRATKDICTTPRLA